MLFQAYVKTIDLVRVERVYKEFILRFFAFSVNIYVSFKDLIVFCSKNKILFRV